jgi:hypothetical protein
MSKHTMKTLTNQQKQKYRDAQYVTDIVANQQPLHPLALAKRFGIGNAVRHECGTSFADIQHQETGVREA